MTQESATPPGFWERVEQVAERVVARSMRSGANRNMSLSAGGRFTIKGGALVVEAADGSASAYFGGVYPAMPDGTVQPGMILRREDGTIAAALYDPTPDPGSPDGFKQFFAIYDRAGNIILSDDTSSGQGHARPWLSGGFAATRYADFRFTTTSATFETVTDMYISKQQPQMTVYCRSSMDTADTTGELRVMVDGVQLGATAGQSFAVAGNTFTGPVAGAYGPLIRVEIQGRRTSATGALKIEPMYWQSRQS